MTRFLTWLKDRLAARRHRRARLYIRTQRTTWPQVANQQRSQDVFRRIYGAWGR